jgi:hypothetical protein
MPTASSLGRPDVVTGILPVDSHDVLILFDSGATYSFVSLDFVKKVGLARRFLNRCKLVPLEG